MIDEELYQQAADELNTDRRRAHIWARACALASDDHDEARYLYTNLRVEELIAEREANGGAAADPSVLDVDEHDATLALEPVSFEEDGATEEKFGFMADDEFSLGESEDVPSSVSTPAGVDSSKNNNDDDLFELLPSGLGDTDSQLDDTSQLDGTAVLDLDSDDLAEFQASIPAEDYETFDAQAAASLEEAEEALQLDGMIPPSSAPENVLSEEASPEFDALADDGQSVSGLPEIEGLDDDNAPPRNQALQQNDDDLNELLDGVYPASKGLDGIGSSLSSEDADEALTADFSDASGTQAVMLDDELDWLDDEVAQVEPDAVVMDNALEPYQPAALDHDDTDRFTQELERQADEMPGQHSDVVAHEVPEQPDISPAATPDKTEHVGQNLDDVYTEDSDRESQVAAAAFTATAAGAAATAATLQTGSDSGHADHAPAALAGQAREFPLDLSEDSTGTPYSVYRRDTRVQAVKDGVSWSALLMTVPFLIYRQLFGTAIVYTLMSIILLAGLLVMGLAWFDAGIAATPLVKGATIGFAVLAAIGLLYIPFRYGNTWRGDKLENRGFELIAWVRAKNPGKAIAQARRAAALD